MDLENEFIAYTKSLAYLLRKRGFDIIRVDVNRRQPERNVYVFKRTEEFDKALEEILSQKKICEGIHNEE